LRAPVSQADGILGTPDGPGRLVSTGAGRDAASGGHETAPVGTSLWARDGQDGILPVPGARGALQNRKDMAGECTTGEVADGQVVVREKEAVAAECLEGTASGMMAGRGKARIRRAGRTEKMGNGEAAPSKGYDALSPRFKARAPSATRRDLAQGSDSRDQPDGHTDTSHTVTITVKVGGSNVSVPVTRQGVTEASRYPGTGADAVRRAISTALRDTLGFDKRTMLLLRMEYLVPGAVLFDELVPEDYAELEGFVALGGSCRTGARLCGGMDAEARRTWLGGQRFDGNTQYDLLDTYMTEIRANKAAPEGPPHEYSLAQALLDDFRFGQWDPLEALTREPGFVGTVSPSRLAVLRVAALKAYEQDGVFGILPEMSAAPAWVGRGDLVAIKINDVAPRALFPHGLPEYINMAMVKDAAIRGVLAAIPTMATESGYNRNLIESEIQVEGNTKELVGLLSVTMVIPTGPGGRTTDLLTGRLVIWPGSFVTLDPVGLFAEVALSPRDNTIIRAIGTALDIPYPCFRKLLNSAFSRAYETSFALVRYTTSKATGTGKDREVHSFGPGEGDSMLKIGLSVMSVIMTRRSTERLLLGLGPVALGIECLPCPHHVLKELVSPGADPPLIPLGVGGPRSPLILFAPLPKEWLTKVANRDKVKRIQTQLDLSSICQRHLGVSDVSFLGRREKGYDAFALLLEFRTTDQAGQFLTAFYGNGHSVHLEVHEVFHRLFEGPVTVDKVFASMVPREALATLVEKDFRALLAKARAAGPDNPAQA